MIVSLPEFRTKFQFEKVIQYFKERVSERSKAHEYVALAAGRQVLADKLGETIDVVSEGSTRELLFYGYNILPVRDTVGTILGFNESVLSDPVIRVRLRKLPSNKGTAVQVTVLDESYQAEALFLTERLERTDESTNEAMVEQRGPNAGTAAKVQEVHDRLKEGAPWKTVKRICSHETYMKWCFRVTGEEPITK